MTRTLTMGSPSTDVLAARTEHLPAKFLEDTVQNVLVPFKINVNGVKPNTPDRFGFSLAEGGTLGRSPDAMLPVECRTQSDQVIANDPEGHTPVLPLSPHVSSLSSLKFRSTWRLQVLWRFRRIRCRALTTVSQDSGCRRPHQAGMPGTGV
jgi:hypothetical protein